MTQTPRPQLIFRAPATPGVTPDCFSGPGGMVYFDDPTTTETRIEGKIRCLIADDHVLVRQGVRRLLQDEADVEVVGEAGDAAEALKGVMELRPDILLMDIGMPGF